MATATTTTILAPPQDLEVTLPPSQTHDPYRLSSALKSPAEISALSDTKSTHHRIPFHERILPNYTHRRRRSSVSGTPSPTTAVHPRPTVDVKGLKAFYERQNNYIQYVLKSVDDHRSEARDEMGDTRLRAAIAIQGSFIANLVLAGLQIYAAVSSGSLSLFATMADSIFDPLSNLLLILSHRAVRSVDASRFPSGKARLETAGNIGFSFLMIAVSLILIVLSIRDISSGHPSDTKSFHLPPVIAVSIALTVKLILFLYCYSLKNTYSQIGILWRDHRNDLPVNAFGLLTSIAGAKLRWWVDPMGAIIIGVVILLAWGKVVYNESLLLIGVTASHEMRGLITYVAMTHSEKITHIDTVRAYHSGPRIIVEVDIVMDAESKLRETHDIAEALQEKLEALPDVERAYVHVDYEVLHKPEHFLKKEL